MPLDAAQPEPVPATSFFSVAVVQNPDREPVSTPDSDWPEWRVRAIEYENAAAPGFPSLTRESISTSALNDLLIFREGDMVDSLTLLEARWTLLRSGKFSDVQLEINEIAPREANIRIAVQDRPLPLPMPQIDIGGEQEDFGLSLVLPGLPFVADETRAGPFALSHRHSSENDMFHETAAELYLPLPAALAAQASARLTEYGDADSNSTTFAWSAALALPYSSPYDRLSIGLRAQGEHGRAYDYRRPQAEIQDQRIKLEAWVNRAFIEEDRFFAGALIGYLPQMDSDNEWRGAAEGSGYVLVGFSSLAQDFGSAFVDSDGSVTTPLGARGNVAFGKFFPVGSSGEHFVYAGGSAASSAMVNKKMYLYGMLGAGSGFRDGAARYTHLSTEGLGHFELTEHVTLAGRIAQQTSWNWPAQRQAVLDNHAGLRAYDANLLVGDNTLLATLELRLNPIVGTPRMGLEAAAFYDAGVVWNLDQQIADQRVHSAAGVGLRLHHDWLSGRDVLRLDLAWNMETSEFGQIILSTRMPFSLFGSHEFELPALIGAEFDRR